MSGMDSAQPVDGSAQNSVLGVDPFLVEALQNPRHRLTILRMELDVQRFLQNTEQHQFEFQHFPTSYLRLAAHRVAQHYGLQTMVLENGIDGLVNKIVAMKIPESKFPSVCLSEVPAKQSENFKPDHVKIVIRPRPHRNTSGEFGDGVKQSPVRTVEEREEEYSKARARIFSGGNSGSSSSDESPQVSVEPKTLPSVKDESDLEKTVGIRDSGCSSRVAIFRDREKDRFDPDYDRSYKRYVKGFPTNQRLVTPLNMPSFQPPLVQYNSAFPQVGQMPRTQSPLTYGLSDPSMNQFCSMGLDNSVGDAMYMQWPNPAMMYAHSYEPFRHAVFQAPFCQQPLSFDYSQNR